MTHEILSGHHHTNAAENALYRNINKREKLFVYLPRDLDALKHLMCSSLARATPFHQV